MHNELRPLLSDENQLAVVFAVAGDMSDQSHGFVTMCDPALAVVVDESEEKKRNSA